MFLSKIGSFYYLFFDDDEGRRHKTSTHCARKSDALKFLKAFDLKKQQTRAERANVSLMQFSKVYLEYSRTVHTPSTQGGFQLGFDQLVKTVGDLPLRRVGPREIDILLAKKREEASEWTARKYYIALSSAFETAKKWNYIESNPFRLVARPKMKEVHPAHFSKDEFNTLLRKISDTDFKELCISAAFTGLRLSELTVLQ